MSMILSKEKEKWRIWLKKELSNFPFSKYSNALLKVLKETLLTYTVIGGYKNLNDEINLEKLYTHIKSQRGEVCFPYNSQKEKILFYDPLPAVILVPGLAFDQQFYRLGRGGGYFDATLAFYRKHHPQIKFIGICPRKFYFNRLPREEHDQPMNKVIAY